MAVSVALEYKSLASGLSKSPGICIILRWGLLDRRDGYQVEWAETFFPEALSGFPFKDSEKFCKVFSIVIIVLPSFLSLKIKKACTFLYGPQGSYEFIYLHGESRSLSSYTI